MKKPGICAVVVNNDLETVANEVEADLFELRIDLIGEGWQQLVKRLDKPWIACNRTVAEGGQWQGNEARRIEPLLQATVLGADVIDIELNTGNLENIVKIIKKTTKLLLSYHDLEKTPSLDEMKKIVRKQLKAGADICKVVTTARDTGDNLTILQLIGEFPEVKIIAFAMGPLGLTSRILCPLVGGEFTYAAIAKGKESAVGQITVGEMRRIYEMISVE
jgi:3-dehydroquinate dehydratase-1